MNEEAQRTIVEYIGSRETGSTVRADQVQLVQSGKVRYEGADQVHMRLEPGGGRHAGRRRVLANPRRSLAPWGPCRFRAALPLGRPHDLPNTQTLCATCMLDNRVRRSHEMLSRRRP